MAQVIYLMLRKGMPKGKLLSALNTIMRRSKVAGKEVIQSLIFHHHHAVASMNTSSPAAAAPPHRAFHVRKHRKSGGQCPSEQLSEAGLMVAAEMAAASPALLGFGATPMVRQLRVTDSPFPLRDMEENCHMDEAAEEFIKKFYRDLRQQNSMAFSSYS